MAVPVNFWVRGNVEDLIACGIIALLTIFEYKYQVVTKFKKIPEFSFYYVVVSIAVFMSWAVITFGFDLFKYSGNFLNYRVFGVFDVGHYLVWVSIFFILLRYAAVKDLIVGWMSAALFVSIHEGVWYLTYFVAYPQQFGITVWFYSPFLLLLILMIPAYFVIVPKKQIDILPDLTDEEKDELRKAWKAKLSRKTFGPKFEYAIRRIWRKVNKAERIPRRTIIVTMAIVVVFDLMWYLSGFQLSIDNIYGRSIFYFDPVTNGLEDMSWVLPMVAYILG